jgi:hypothetical protein
MRTSVDEQPAFELCRKRRPRLGERNAAVKDVGRHDDVCAGIGIPEVDEFERRRVAAADDDRDLGVGVQASAARLVRCAWFEQRRRRQMPDGDRLAEAFGVPDAELPADSFARKRLQLPAQRCGQARVDPRQSVSRGRRRRRPRAPCRT